MNRTESGSAACSSKGQGPAKRINLALQGGGSHSAFTWGVLDRLLHDSRFEIDSICGTSGGAINAAVLASGYSRDGRAGAQQDLRELWRRIGAIGRFSVVQRSFLGHAVNRWRLDYSPAFHFVDLLTRIYSPSQLNPTNYSPLREILRDLVDFDRLRHASGIKVFVCATNVRSGKAAIFRNSDIGVDVLLASACLPYLFQTVKIDDEYYWDGGYMGNPAIWPLAYESEARDLIIVEINPLRRDEIPQTAHEIRDRLDEISFNSTLIREMRAIHFVNRLIDGGKLDPREYKRTNIHLIDSGEAVKDLHASSKLNAEPAFLDHLFGLGQAAADEWIRKNFEAVGHRSSVDVAGTFL